MRIGILTLPLHTNYGGILQAYALYSVVKNMGHDVWLIDGKMYEITTLREKASVFVWQMMHHFGWRKTIHPQLIMRDEMENIIPFIENHLPQQIALDKVGSNTFDAIVVGSDQVWRGEYSDLLPYFLDFTIGWDIRRIAYAASFGKDEWHQDSNILAKCRQLIKGFNYVSVREQSGINICKQNLQIDAEWVIDPTMLKNAEEYRCLFCPSNTTNKRHLVSYILDGSKDKHDMVYEVARRKKLSVTEMELPANGEKAFPVEQWLYTIANADFVLTDSFHGTVFCILFNRPFAVIENSERGNSRLVSLLKIFGLTNRIVHDVKELSFLEDGFIEWNKVNTELIRQQNRCLKVLSSALS